jgi:hypothetical protein
LEGNLTPVPVAAAGGGVDVVDARLDDQRHGPVGVLLADAAEGCAAENDPGAGMAGGAEGGGWESWQVSLAMWLGVPHDYRLVGDVTLVPRHAPCSRWRRVEDVRSCRYETKQKPKSAEHSSNRYAPGIGHKMTFYCRATGRVCRMALLLLVEAYARSNPAHDRRT